MHKALRDKCNKIYAQPKNSTFKNIAEKRNKA